MKVEFDEGINAPLTFKDLNVGDLYLYVSMKPTEVYMKIEPRSISDGSKESWNCISFRTNNIYNASDDTYVERLSGTLKIKN